MSKLIHKVADCQHGWPAEQCGRPAEWDIRTVSGQWANLCDTHKILDCLPGADEYGYRLSREPLPEVSDGDRRLSIRTAIESGDFDLADDLIGDGDLAEWL